MPLAGLASRVDAQSDLNIIYIMRNDVSVGRWLCRLRMAMVSVFLILAPLLRIVLLLDFIGTFEALRDTIPRKLVSAELLVGG